MTSKSSASSIAGLPQTLLCSDQHSAVPEPIWSRRSALATTCCLPRVSSALLRDICRALFLFLLSAADTQAARPHPEKDKDSTSTAQPPLQPPINIKSPNGKDDKSILPKLPPIDKERFFIKSIEVGPGLNTLDRDLLQRVVDELPSSILTARKLEYYDPSAIIDTAKWKLDEHSTTLEPDAILKALLAEKLRWMLLLSISLAPGGRDEKRMLLTGRLIDLVEQNCRITRANVKSALSTTSLTPESEQSIRKEYESIHCLDKKYPVYTGAVDLKDFDELRPSVRSLFAMLFEIPEIEKTHLTAQSFSTEQRAIIRYDIKSNLRKKDADLWINYRGFEGYSVEAKLYPVTPELEGEVCRNPRRSLRNARDWGNLFELGHDVIDLKIQPKAGMRTFGSGEGVASVLLAEHYEGVYLLGATLIAVKQQDSYRAMTVPADPSVVCIHLYEPRLRYGFGVRWNSLFASFADSLSFGVDFGLSYKRRSVRRALLPALAFGPQLGLGYQPLLPNPDALDSPLRHRTTIELRLRLMFDVIQLPYTWAPLTLVAFGDAGLGIEWYGATVDDLARGWQTYAAYGGGGGVRIWNTVLLSVWFQQIYRWLPLTAPQNPSLDLPTTADHVWVQLTFEGARPNANLRRRRVTREESLP